MCSVLCSCRNSCVIYVVFIRTEKPRRVQWTLSNRNSQIRGFRKVLWYNRSGGARGDSAYPAGPPLPAQHTQAPPRPLPDTRPPQTPACHPGSVLCPLTAPEAGPAQRANVSLLEKPSGFHATSCRFPCVFGASCCLACSSSPPSRPPNNPGSRLHVGSTPTFSAGPRL